MLGYKTALLSLIIVFATTLAGQAAELIDLMAICRHAGRSDSTVVTLRYSFGAWAVTDLENVDLEVTNLADWAKLTTIESIDFLGPQPFPMEAAVALAKFSSLRKLVPRYYISEQGWKAICELQKLTTLDLGYLLLNENLSPTSLQQIRDLVHLKSLSINGEQFLASLGLFLELEDLHISLMNSEWDMSELVSLKRLSRLRTEYLYAAGLASIGRLQNLQSLRISTFVPAAGSDALLRLANLKELEVDWIFEPTTRIRLPAGLEKLSCRPETALNMQFEQSNQIQIVELNLSGSSGDKLQVGERMARMQWLGAILKLEELSLIEPVADDFASIPQKRNVQKLSVIGENRRNSNADEVLRTIAEWTHLKSLNVTDITSITDSGMSHLSELRSLQSLRINGFCHKMTPAGLESIWGMKELRILELPDGAFELEYLATAVPSICRLSKLEELSLTGRLPDDTLLKLSALGKLRLLDLRRCTGYTDIGLASLVEKLPSLETLKLTTSHR